MRTKEDARVRKTKAKLLLAFRDLLAEKTFEDITIHEICIRADIRRATFYKHFKDKYDFLAAMTAELISEFDDKMSRSKYKNYPIEYHVEYERRLFEFLIENEDIVNFVLKSSMLPTVLSIIVEANYKVLIERLEHSVENGVMLVASVSTVATALSGGIGNILVKWFTEGKPCSVEELSIQMENIVRAMFIVE